MAFNDILNVPRVKTPAFYPQFGIIPQKFAEGGTSKNSGKTITPTNKIEIGGQQYKVAVARTEKEKYEGLSSIDYLPENYGMLFVYEEPQKDLWFTMADTKIPLDIIFISDDMEVLSVHHCKALSKDPVEDTSHRAQYVLEVNYRSGIRVSDELEGFQEAENSEEVEDDSAYTEEEKEAAKKSKMLVLDENGDVQMKLVGGERIFSRISTRKFIKAAIKAFRTDDDADYRRVGKLVFTELNAQDDRKPEYVQKS